MIFNVHQAKSQLSKLIALALQGEEVIIARGATPVVRLTAVRRAEKKRHFGAFEDELELTEAFFEPLPDDELVLWNGGGDQG